MEKNTAIDQFVTDDPGLVDAWRAYDSIRARIATQHAEAEAAATDDPSGMVAGFAFSVIWGAGFFALGYLASVWGWV